MRNIIQLAFRFSVWKDRQGQDLIEYALVVGFVVTVASAILPGIASNINIIFSKVNSS